MVGHLGPLYRRILVGPYFRLVSCSLLVILSLCYYVLSVMCTVKMLWPWNFFGPTNDGLQYPIDFVHISKDCLAKISSRLFPKVPFDCQWLFDGGVSTDEIRESSLRHSEAECTPTCQDHFETIA